MSGHLIGCVKSIKGIPSTHKLALTAFADSGDDRTHIALPGYEGVQEWADCSRGRAAEVIRDLVEWGYLKHHKRGHRGQRAEYIVFPNGCCKEHPKPVEEKPVDVEQLAQAAGVTVDEARLMLTALGTITPPADPEKGYEPAGPNHGGKGPANPDPIGAETAQTVDDGVDNPGKGPERIHESRSNTNAVTPSTTTPQPPTSRGSSCDSHPNGRANCRACGTTPRQIAAAERKAAADRRRVEQAALVEADRLARAAAPAPSPETIAAAKAAARAGIIAATTRKAAR